MKIILLKDDKNLGRKNQVVEVADGYARNFVIPKKIGVIANKANMAKLNATKTKAVDDLKDKVAKLVKIKTDIEKKEIEVVTTLDKTGGVQGQISTKRISDEIQKQTGHKVEKKCIEKKTISAIGVTTLKVELFKGVTATIKINVRGK